MKGSIKIKKKTLKNIWSIIKIIAMALEITANVLDIVDKIKG